MFKEESQMTVQSYSTNEEEKMAFNLTSLQQSTTHTSSAVPVGLSLFESTVHNHIPHNSAPKVKKLPPPLIDLLTKKQNCS